MNYRIYNILLFLVISFSVQAQNYWSKIEAKEPTLGIAEVFQNFETPEFQLKLVKSSQTVASLRPKENPRFDFTPGDRLEIRDKDGLYHLGDINLRIKDTNGTWKSYSTAAKRATVQPLETSATILAAADLSNTLPSDIPVAINRYYEVDKDHLVIRFELSNKSNQSVEIGALGVPMVFNNILEGKSLVETHAQNVFFDPYIGKDAGYLEVKRLTGEGSVLLVLPKENMSFEAYRPLLDDPTPRSIVFEGFHEWMVHSKAYAEIEWKGVEQWNTPTSLILEPKQTKNFSFKLVLSKGIREVQETLVKEEIPVVNGFPGYVLPQDVKGQLFIDYNKQISSLSIEPKDALELMELENTPKGQQKFSITGKKWGRARLLITYSDGKQQSVNYKVIKPETEVVKDFGNFLATKQWFNDTSDPFHRTKSFISYDYDQKRMLTEDSRVWISGLSDEGGAGSWLAAVMKQLIQPEPSEIKKVEQFIDSTLWGGIQYSDGPNVYGVKKSIFYYEPDSLPKGTYSEDINYKTWAAWNHEHANDPGRSYNYPHVAAAYWVMYRLARYREGLVNNRLWEWYLKNAYQTSIAMLEKAPYYSVFGQMEGSVFLYILEDLKNESYTDLGIDLENRMKERANHWRALDYPFGSEMPWDSTGQEEVYLWSNYFGYDEKAKITLNAILAYMPTMPHWAYNGNARRYWDFLYGGKAGETSRVERQIHHYGSSLNAIPVLTQYRKTPDDLYLLKVGYGGLLGGISNITQDGFGPAAFHSFPSTLQIDGISGDYGSGFYGYAVNSATYLTYDDDMGWLAFGGNLNIENDIVEVKITTASKSKLFIGPIDLWITLDAGTIKKLTYNVTTKKVTITLGEVDEFTPNAYLRTNKMKHLSYDTFNGAYKVPLKDNSIEIEL